MEKKSKTISMESKTTEAPTGKYTYEQLEQIAGSLHAQCMQLQNSLNEAQEVIAGFNTVGLLLSIVEKGEYFDQGFTDRCANKIQEVVTGMLDAAEKNGKKDNE